MMVVAAIFIMHNATVSAQIDGEFLKGGINDGMKLIEAFMAPWIKAFGAGFSGGWYNTAKTHSPGGFDITLTLSVGMVPQSATTFDVNSIDFDRITLVDPNSPTIASTIAGPANPGPMMNLVSASAPFIELIRFESPKGLGVKIAPVPMVQVGIGLPLGSEIVCRFLPKIEYDDGSVGMWGIGLKHSIMQYIPGNKLMPFDVSLFGGYTRLIGKYPISIQPDNYTYYTSYDYQDFSRQFIAGEIEGWNASAIASFNLPVISFYGGLGYTGSKAVVDINGNIPLPEVDLALSTTGPVYKDSGVVQNVRGFEIENFSGLRANIGFRLKFSLLTIHADYTRSQYNVFTGGLGISFR